MLIFHELYYWPDVNFGPVALSIYDKRVVERHIEGLLLGKFHGWRILFEVGES